MLLALLLQASLVVKPLHLEADVPRLVSARHILIGFEGAQGVASQPGRTRDAALEFARDLVPRLRAGKSFEQAAIEFSRAPDARYGAVLGTFASGVLAPEFDAFLLPATDGEISDPLPTASGVHILQRIATQAAVRRILLAKGTPEERARLGREILGQLQAGADFAGLARQHSDDAESAARGGAYQIYERGPHDKLLKALAFQMPLGEYAQLDTPPLGLNLIQRVSVDTLPAALAENSFVRLRGVLVRYQGLTGMNDPLAPNALEAKHKADRLRARAIAGEDLQLIAREADDDLGGREREGDLGWIHRGTPGLLAPVSKGFLLRIGDIGEVESTDVGWLFVRREL